MNSELTKSSDKLDSRALRWLEPLLDSFAFARLSNITFLGILSPRYAFLPDFPFKTPSPIFDGTRADHSLGVAALFLEIAKSLKLSEKAQRYGLVWAALHDIATWPLSHTGEAAFCDITKISSNSLREAMITGSPLIPSYLSVGRQLERLRIDISELLRLYEKSHNSLTGELSILWKVVNSPLTPDTLEGMHRSGRVFQVPTPDPTEITDSFESDLFRDAFIESEKSEPVLEFWRAKSRIYKTYINSKKAIDFESRWVLRIEHCFPQVGLVESLLLPENCIVSMALSTSDERLQFREKRYKAPLKYYVTTHHAKKSKLSRQYELDDLSEVLSKARKNFYER